ncbi:MAG: ABC transporter ATP-binding protein [Chitinophagaceae bacterium]|jgi:peptide/nickel transport system ATP-binding protein
MLGGNTILSVSNLHISFPAQNFEAIKNISFSLEKGKTLAIVGESGSGKSLIALSIMGLQPNNSVLKGNINFGEQNLSLTNLSADEWQSIRGKELGMIFQEPMSALNPIQKVGKQIQENIEQHQKISSKEAKTQTLDWISKVKLPDPEQIYERFPHQLSGGQKQRIMIAMAMCHHPAILIADEPTTALDATVQKDVVELMKELQREMETAMIFITHDLALAAEIANDLLVMNQGNIVEYGNSKNILNSPEQVYTKALLSCRPNISNKGKKLPVVADFLSGNVNQEILSTHECAKEKPILEIKDLHVWYPEEKNLFGKTTSWFKAVNGVSFAIHKGQTLGLVGESGCGKSTVGKTLLGLTPIKSGQIIFNQQQIESLKGNEWNSVRRKMQLIFQDPFASLNPRRNIADIITEPLQIHESGKNKKAEAERLLDWVQLPKSAANRYPHQFSGGQRQRIGIARALALHPELLICDESVSALDVSVQAQILNLLKELQYELNLSYLFISHDLSVVHYMSDNIIVMKKGQIAESGTANEILLAPKEDYTQNLIAAMPELHSL